MTTPDLDPATERTLDRSTPLVPVAGRRNVYVRERFARRRFLTEAHQAEALGRTPAPPPPVWHHEPDRRRL